MNLLFRAEGEESRLCRDTICVALAGILINLANPKVVDATQVFEQDLDGDGVVEVVHFTPRGEPYLRVYRDHRLLWQWGRAVSEAWKLQLIDLDEDGFTEFAVGVNRSTRWYPDRQNTLHLLGWTGHYGYAKWLGSRLGSPLDDFTLTRFHAGQPVRLATLERDRQNRQFVRVYRWSGFGFTALWQSAPLPEPMRMTLRGQTLYLVSRRYTFVLRQPTPKLTFTLEEEPHHAHTAPDVPHRAAR